MAATGPEGRWLTRRCSRPNGSVAELPLPFAAERQYRYPDAMTCPDCQSSLEVQHVGAVEVDYCRPCGSAWFDRGEFDAVRSSVRGTDVATTCMPTNSPAGACPRCEDHILLSGSIGMAAIARCEKCRGLWIPNPTRLPQQRSSDWDLLWPALRLVRLALN